MFKADQRKLEYNLLYLTALTCAASLWSQRKNDSVGVILSLFIVATRYSRDICLFPVEVP